ncbi:MAG: flagellar protein FlbB [Spirochaetaceae bacterium]|nr:flagellar protein FlbB [Spirochaetaceae bacterium]MBO7485148.1 flagellar protein FlbB [Spirochaetaceae bacterium]MBP5329548.1 flagellar protein FlbB [Spirochaetaceae bacterium]
MSAKGTIGKTIVLLVLIVILIFLALFWFDYLGVIQAKKFFSPVYRLFGLQPQTSVTVTGAENVVEADLDADRLAKRLESLDLRKQELDKRESDIHTKEAEFEQIAQELEERKVSQEEREKTFEAIQKQYEDKENAYRQIANNLYSMKPDAAVNILVAMEDQLVIDVIRKEKELSTELRRASMSSYWLSLMPPERAAVIERKTTNKPVTLE